MNKVNISIDGLDSWSGKKTHSAGGIYFIVQVSSVIIQLFLVFMNLIACTVCIKLRQEFCRN